MDCILTRYSEIGIKSNKVRRKFEKILDKNTKVCLEKNNIKIKKIIRRGPRSYIYCENFEKALKILKYVFGIKSYSPTFIVKTEIEKIKEKAADMYIKGKTFKIDARRTTKEFKYTSLEINKIVGEYIVKKFGGKVNLENPEIKIGIEVNGPETFLYSKEIEGYGGLPIGVSGRLICVIRNELDILASLLVMKRGCYITPLIEKNFDKNNLKILDKFYNCDENLEIFEFEGNYLGFAEELLERKRALGMVVGETKIEKIKKSKYPIYFPLIGFEKLEIEKIKASLYG